ncbi:thiopeptide-type bacteriocin biosynthesis domain-containing protein [Algoriphagus locisalis]|uniref:Thiopeptide-type bacteriocin biosynthesis domain-containing protein n=1 Tax=Algoriphagus locisalis TaxID=305507 RepID=A0A1I6XWQ2_9BACT|nr:thiopeptide-type bacteriocin biosynthesis protein [Algoriphagus locisalis]SFT42331.1 thiopeptide-type bacteriocin biosynthesis domain-containing protein [Algoriphagus locisalis]
MDILYRAPLLQFDITNRKEVARHWQDLLQAIELSSKDLYHAIKGKNPEELSQKEWKTVYRYLLRGKYRATPFGKWAGVGIAKWGAEEYSNSQTLSQHSPILSTSIASEGNSTYWMNPSLQRWGGGWKFWNFDRQEETWRFSRSEDSPYIQRIREISFDKRTINPAILFRPFPELQLHERREVWHYLTESQLLVPERFPYLPEHERKEDQFIHTLFSVPEIHRNKLENLLEEMSQRALPQRRPYLDKLTRRFTEVFDDRFVPLHLLWKLVPYLNDGSDSSQSGTIDLPEYPLIIQDKNKTFDLKTVPKPVRLHKKPFHAQVLFRILDSGNLLIDNMSFNRPFVYGGRFTHHPQIFSYFQQHLQQEVEMISADVLLFESRKTQAIADHRSVADYVINCFSGSSSSVEFDSSQVYIGMNGERFELYIPHLGKRLKPIIQHPLNPEYITHPLCRILWEVAHQDILRPLHYAHPGFLAASYLPQLNWGDIILQPRRWKFGHEWQGKTEEELMGYLQSKGIPQRVLVGKHDQELVLNLSAPSDRYVLLEELSKDREINIFECLWAENECSSNQPISYPQFLYGKSWPLIKSDNVRSHFNLVEGHENKNWISVRIVLSPDYQQHLVSGRLLGLVSEFEERGIRPFYFLYYPISSPEIRFRVKVNEVATYEYATTQLYTYFQEFPEFEQVHPHAYYPESSKYSQEGMGISEELFYQESKLILESAPTSDLEKFSLAVGIGNLLIETSGNPEYWLALLSRLCKGKAYHSLPDPFLRLFDQIAPKKWQEFYGGQVRQHPWINFEDKQGLFLGNHLHMAINRIFWDSAMEKEREVHSVLLCILRRSKFGKKKGSRRNMENFSAL